MENLETRIQAFLGITDGSDYRFGSGSGNGFGYDEGYGFGDFSDVCYNFSSNFGFGEVSGSCPVSDYGFGISSGSGNASGSCITIGSGCGDWDGDGRGYGFDDGIKELNGDKVYYVDLVPTIIKSVHDNTAQGFIVKSDLTLELCYVVKEQNNFAHGKTLHEAFASLQEKLYDDSTEDERIEAFIKKFPDYDTPYPNRDLFVYHHVLTGSCRMGREVFCKDNDIDLDDSTTVREFIQLTKDSYGSDTIRKLPRAYGINEPNELL